MGVTRPALPSIPTPARPQRVVPHLRLPEKLTSFFEQFIVRPFHNHPPTPAWEEEVRCKDDAYHRQTILDRGRTDFDVPHGRLGSEDKVLLYCFYYMQMHVTSTYQVLQQGTNHGLDFEKDVVLVDFGAGPLTLGVALAWLLRAKGIPSREAPCPTLMFIGIERSRTMIARASTFATESGLLAPSSSFRFVEALAAYRAICDLIDSLATDRVAGPSTLVLNFSYFFSSDSVDVAQLTDVVQSLLRRYRRSTVWVVYQNPQHTGLARKWETLRAGLASVTELAGGYAAPAYLNITNRPGVGLEIKLSYALLRRAPLL